MIDLLDEDLRVAAARVALLALRARLAGRGPPPLNRFRLPGVGRPLGPEVAAMELARKPRPMPLKGVVEGGVVVIRRNPDESWLEPIRAEVLAPRAFRLQPEEYPRLPVCCVGAGEALLVTVEVEESSVRNYPITIAGDYSTDLPCVYMGDYPVVARQAQEAGAICIIRYHFPIGVPSPEDSGDVIVLRSRARHCPRVVEHMPSTLPCAVCHAPAAEWRETATWETPWPDRRLCSVCVAARLAPFALARARRIDAGFRGGLSPRVGRWKTEIAHDLGRLEARFRRLPMPWELAEILDRWRDRLAE